MWMKPASRRGRRGAALLVALMTAGVVAAAVLLMVSAIQSENEATDTLVLDTQATYLAESGAERAIGQLRMAVARQPGAPSYVFTPAADGSVLSGSIAGFEPLVGNPHPLFPTIQWKVFPVESTSREIIPAEGSIGSGSDYAAQAFHSYRLYAVTARGYVPFLPNSDPTAAQASRYTEIYVNKIVELDMVPLFQYLAFYSNTDLEILPGAAATMKGRIHTNRDLYCGAESSASLTFNSSVVWASGAIRRHRKNGPGASNYYMTGTTRFRKQDASSDTGVAPVNDTNYPVMVARGGLVTPAGVTVPTSYDPRGYAPGGYDSDFLGYDGTQPHADGKTDDLLVDLPPFTTGSDGKWNGTVRTYAQEVPVMDVPTNTEAFRLPLPGETPNYKYQSPGAGWVQDNVNGTHVTSEWQAAADIVIWNDKIYDKNGTDITNNLRHKTTGATIHPLSINGNMYDAREYLKYDSDPIAAGIQTTAERNRVKVTEIDVDKLNNAKRNDTGALLFPTTGQGITIYAYRTYTDKYDTADYTKGLEGIRFTNGSVLNNNVTFVSEDPVYVKGDFNTGGADPTKKKTAVLMADAMNIFSNTWDDSKNPSGGYPVPSGPVTVNAAFLGGINDSSESQYNGGLENYARFHENWSGIQVNIKGCFCSLFNTRYATSVWPGTGSPYYKPPRRNFVFDEDLLKVSKQPPNIPYSVGVSRVVWWRGRELTWWP